VHLVVIITAKQPACGKSYTPNGGQTVGAPPVGYISRRSRLIAVTSAGTAAVDTASKAITGSTPRRTYGVATSAPSRFDAHADESWCARVGGG